MEEKKIYIVTGGEYSEYHISAVFSTKEKAEEYMDTVGSDFEIEEYSIDKPIKHEVSIWSIMMEICSKEVLNIYSCGADEKDTIEFMPGTSFRNECIMFTVESDSKEKAIKIVSDRFGAVVANENIIYPLLRVKAVRDNFGWHNYPIYKFKTGEILLKDGHVIDTSNK
jgi:hypothetical protein